MASAVTRHIDGAISLSRHELDITDTVNVRRVINDLRPSVVFNCAAYTGVDAAELEPDVALAVNAEAPARLAEICRSVSAVFVHYSTDQVFGGDSDTPYAEDHRPEPQNRYGHSKLLGELGSLDAGDHVIVIRTAWLMSSTHACFADWVVRQALKGPFQVVDDQVGSPTWADDVAMTTMDVLSVGGRGIFHVVNSEILTKLDVARTIVANVGDGVVDISPISTAELKQLARRPRYTALRSLRLGALGIEEPSSWSARVPARVSSILARLGHKQ